MTFSLKISVSVHDVLARACRLPPGSCIYAQRVHLGSAGRVRSITRSSCLLHPDDLSGADDLANMDILKGMSREKAEAFKRL
jgi:hypothetical protein